MQIDAQLQFTRLTADMTKVLHNEITKDIPQEHLKHIRSNFYSMQVVIKRKLERLSNIPEIKLTMNNGGLKEDKG